jgi:hypothetical protein
MKLDEVLARLDAIPPRDPLALRRDDIPPVRGIYVWYSKATGHPVYVGKAAGSKGLRHLSGRSTSTQATLKGGCRRSLRLTLSSSVVQLSCAENLASTRACSGATSAGESASRPVSRPSTTFAITSR